MKDIDFAHTYNAGQELNLMSVTLCSMQQGRLKATEKPVPVGVNLCHGHCSNPWRHQLSRHVCSAYRCIFSARSQRSRSNTNTLQKLVSSPSAVFFVAAYNLSSSLLPLRPAIEDSCPGTMPVAMHHQRTQLSDHHGVTQHWPQPGTGPSADLLPFCQAHLPLAIPSSPRGPRPSPSDTGCPMLAHLRRHHLRHRAGPRAAPNQGWTPRCRISNDSECHKPSFVARALAYED